MTVTLSQSHFPGEHLFSNNRPVTNALERLNACDDMAPQNRRGGMHRRNVNSDNEGTSGDNFSADIEQEPSPSSSGAVHRPLARVGLDRALPQFPQHKSEQALPASPERWWAPFVDHDRFVQSLPNSSLNPLTISPTSSSEIPYVTDLSDPTISGILHRLPEMATQRVNIPIASGTGGQSSSNYGRKGVVCNRCKGT
jgi:hypothetical protein